MSASEKSRKITGGEFIQNICSQLGLDGVRRIVIDAQHDSIVTMYVEFVGDERLLDVTIPPDISLNVEQRMP